LESGVNPRIVIMTTSPKALRHFFQAQIRFLVSEGFDVHTISSPGEELDECRRNGSVPIHEIAMQRRISPFADVLALLRLSWKLRRLRPAIVHTHTPKAGLLGMIAASMARVPIRIYTINGLRFSTCSGLRRAVLTAADKISCSLATDVLCVSDSLRQEAVALGVCPAFKARTLGHGASHGVDTNTFDPDQRNSVDRRRIRSRYGLPQDAVVLSYIGRIVRDKGIVELSAAWRVLREEFPNLWLFVCGTPESEDPLSPEVLRTLRDDPRVSFAGETVSDMPAVYAASDVCVLPSYREGLPNVALEAQAMRVPIVATHITGTVDAIRDGVTGFLVEPRDPAALVAALKLLIQDGPLRFRMGVAGRAFVSQHFLEHRVSELLAGDYRGLLAASCGITRQQDAQKAS
jgi:glycosyltransferase involved in cell wall biosynthesis